MLYGPEWRVEKREVNAEDSWWYKEKKELPSLKTSFDWAEDIRAAERWGAERLKEGEKME